MALAEHKVSIVPSWMQLAVPDATLPMAPFWLTQNTKFMVTELKKGQ